MICIEKTWFLSFFFLLHFVLQYKAALKNKSPREKGQILYLDLIQYDFLLLREPFPK